MNIENPENLNALYELNDNNDEDVEDVKKKEDGPKEGDPFGEEGEENDGLPLRENMDDGYED